MSDEQGYYATLGVTFRADDAAIGKAYKKLALALHPDKNPGAEAADTFQRVTTSYHIIMDETKRKNYLRLFMIRCYMSQVPPGENGGLRPFYAFSVAKSKNAIGNKTDRLITIDLLEHKLTNYRKDTLKKEFALSALAGVERSDHKALELTLSFKETHPYYIRARCEEQYDTLLSVLQRIVHANQQVGDGGAGAGAAMDEALRLLADDARSPPSSVMKSKVIKRAERSVGSSLVADWQPRFMVMGTTQVLPLRDAGLHPQARPSSHPHPRPHPHPHTTEVSSPHPHPHPHPHPGAALPRRGAAAAREHPPALASPPRA